MVIEMQTVKEIANYLKAWRRQNTTMRQEDVGVKANLSKQHYQRIESGSDLKLNTLLAVLDVLGLEIRLVPKGKQVKDADEIDNLVAKAKLKSASAYQYHQSVNELSSSGSSNNRVKHSRLDGSSLTARELLDKDKKLQAVFGSRLAKRRKSRAVS